MRVIPVQESENACNKVDRHQMNKKIYGIYAAIKFCIRTSLWRIFIPLSAEQPHYSSKSRSVWKILFSFYSFQKCIIRYIFNAYLISLNCLVNKKVHYLVMFEVMLCSYIGIG